MTKTFSRIFKNECRIPSKWVQKFLVSSSKWWSKLSMNKVASFSWVSVVRQLGIWLKDSMHFVFCTYHQQQKKFQPPPRSSEPVCQVKLHWICETANVRENACVIITPSSYHYLHAAIGVKLLNRFWLEFIQRLHKQNNNNEM